MSSPTDWDLPFDSKLGRLYTAREAAERLGCHVRTVWRMIKDGRLKAVDIAYGKERHQWRIAQAHLKPLLEARATNGDAGDDEPAPIS